MSKKDSSDEGPMLHSRHCFYQFPMHILLFYKYIDVADPVTEANIQRALCKGLDLRGRIFIGAEGINGTCSGTPEACEIYKTYLNRHPLFQGISFKESSHQDHVFRKLFVRVRNEVVTLRSDVSAKDAAPYITPKELHEALERGDDLVLIDMRNDYEAAVGKFRNAITLTMKNFRDLPDLLPTIEQFKQSTVVTYCTGGIRCEKASALLRKHGFTNIRQLEGGIVRYCEAYPDGFYDGSLFVFDERMCMRFPGRIQPPSYTSSCLYCEKPCDRCINCRDSLCHTLMICCEACEKKHNGMCKEKSMVRM